MPIIWDKVPADAWVAKYYNNIFLGLIIFYVSIRLYFFHSYPMIIPEGDAQAYLLLSREYGLWSAPLLLGERPPGYPIFLKLFSGNFNAIYSVQFIISVVSVISILCAASRVLKSYILKMILFVVLIPFFLNADLLIWDKWIITEALSLSTFLIILSFLLYWGEKPTVLNLSLLAVLWVYWGALRDGNIPMLFFLILYIFAGAIVGLTERRYLWLCIVLIPFIIYSNYAIEKNKRYWINLANVISLRILNDEEGVSYFQKKGMPLNDEVLKRRGRQVGDNYESFFKNEELTKFRTWAINYGKDTYLRYLVTHPEILLMRPFRDSSSDSIKIHRSVRDLSIREVFEKRLDEGYQLEQTPLIFRRVEGDILNIYIVGGAYLFAIVYLIRNLLKKGKENDQRINWILFFIISSYPFMLILWHSDAWDVWRHLLPAMVQFKLGIVLLGLFLLDGMIAGRILKK